VRAGLGGHFRGGSGAAREVEHGERGRAVGVHGENLDGGGAIERAGD
jgi:hypothetical protein